MSLDTEMIIVFGAFTAVLASFVAFVCLEDSLGQRFTLDGIIKEKHYSPGSTSTGVGPVIGGNGGMVMTTSSTSAEWVLLVDVKGFDEYQEVKVDGKDYKKAQAGQKVRVEFLRRKWSKRVSAIGVQWP